MNRREFLRQLAALGLVHPLSWAANGQAGRPHFFVQLMIQGGADVLCGLDPIVRPVGVGENSLYINYGEDDISTAGALRLGPAAAPLIPHSRDCAIVNGIWMVMKGPVGHGFCRSYMASGRPVSALRTTHLAADIAQFTAKTPFGVVAGNNGFKNSDHPEVSDVRTGFLNSMNRDQVKAVDALGRMAGRDAFGFYRSMRNFVSSRGDMVRFIDKRNEYRQEFGDKLSDEQIVASAFEAEFSYQGFIVLNRGSDLDNHRNYEMQIPNQQKVWQRVANIFQLFKSRPFGAPGSSLFDYTTFLVSNDFSRPPQLNGRKGKDHNGATNSILLAGKGVQHGVVGASQFFPWGQLGKGPAHAGLPYNGRLLRPEHVAATIADIFAINRGQLPHLRPEYASLKSIIAR